MPMSRLARTMFVMLFAALLASPLAAKNKVPSAYDGIREGAIEVGGVNYPVKLVGVAQDWDSDCRRGKTAQCTRFAEALTTGVGDLLVDPIGATGYFQFACDAGDAKSCARALDFYGSAQLIYHSKPEVVLATARRGCEQLGEGNACGHLARMLYWGKGAPLDKERALTLWHDSCDKGAETACHLMADTLYALDDLDANFEAYEIYFRHCQEKDYDWGWACGGLARAYWEDRAVDADIPQAQLLAEYACIDSDESSPWACGLYADHLVDTGSAEEKATGTQMLAAACRARVGDACYFAGINAKNPPRGTKYKDWEIPGYFRDACDLDQAAGCRELAELYSTGRVVNKSEPIAYAIARKACGLGDEQGCDYVATIDNSSRKAAAIAAIPPIDPALTGAEQVLAALAEVRRSGPQTGAAVDTISRLNSENFPQGIYVLAEWFDTGLPPYVPKSRQNAVTLYENAASQGQEDAAIEISMAYWSGDTVPEDHEKAKGYMRIAARGGDNDMAEALLFSMENEQRRNELIEEARTFDARMKEMNERAQRARALQARYSPSSWGSSGTSASRPRLCRYSAARGSGDG